MMRTSSVRSFPPRRVAAFAAAMALLPVLACLEEPEIDERWTTLEFLASSPAPDQARAADRPLDVSVQGRITYRRIVTGFVVAEVRYSPTINPSSVALNPAENTLEDAREIDMILANSVTAGRATRAVTGFDHLMQDVTMSFTAAIPAAAASGTGGLYLLLYMGSGDEIELASGEDSLVVTPFRSSDHEVLHTGYALSVTPGPGAP